MARAHNFSAGPTTLPESVLAELADEMPEFGNTGMSVVEMSHRGGAYEAIHHEAIAALRRLSGAPDGFDILLLQGGASLQFAMVPMNILGEGTAGYVVAGTWGTKALKDATKIGDAYSAWSLPKGEMPRNPAPSDVEVRDGLTYLHVTSNETIGGVRYPSYDGLDARLVGDMSSDLLSRTIPWDQFDLVYGGAQKNLGPAGVTVVFMRRSLLDRIPESVPGVLRYDTHAKADSLANTPSVFAIWAMGKTLAWMEELGGVPVLAERAAKRSGSVYNAIDSSAGFYQCPVHPDYRSQTNVVWRLPSEELEARFLVEAEAERLLNLKGHRSVGGIRASIYNAMTDEGVATLVDFMGRFAATNS